jgi:hypothetical protein
MRQFVVFELADGTEEIHGGPYGPGKARKLKDTMETHIEKGDHDARDIPENTESVVLKNKWELNG